MEFNFLTSLLPNAAEPKNSGKPTAPLAPEPNAAGFEQALFGEPLPGEPGKPLLPQPEESQANHPTPTQPGPLTPGIPLAEQNFLPLQNPASQEAALVSTPNTPLEQPANVVSPELWATLSAKPENFSENLTALTEFIRTKVKVKDAAPILAFLTGDLQNMAPQDIPKLVMSNEFVASTLASDDMATFLDQPLPVKKVLHSIGFDQSISQVATQLGFNLNETITPRNFLTAIGIDTQRVTSELQMLKDNLQLEGLNPYMTRAVALRGRSTDQVGWEQKPLPGKEQNVAAEQQLPVADTTAEPHAQFPAAAGGAQLAKTVTDQIPHTNFTAKTSTKDPFHEIDKSAASGKTLRRDLRDEPSHELPRATLLGNPRPETSLTAAATDTPAPSHLVSLEKAMEQKIQESTKSSPEPKTAVQHNPEAVLATNPKTANTPKTKAAVTEKMDISELSARLATISSMEDLASGERQPGDGGQGFTGKQNAKLDLTSAMADVNVERSDTNNHTSFAAVVNEPQPAENLFEKVMERATMLVKEDGGSLRIDLGSPELGSLDLAVKVTDDKLDVKIMAASEAARDLLMQDIPKLREALQSQNLHLNQVEVGVQGSSAWAHNSNQQSTSRESFESFKQTTDNSGLTKSLTSVSRAKWSSVPRADLQRPQHAGQIQVLV